MMHFLQKYAYWLIESDKSTGEFDELVNEYRIWLIEFDKRFIESVK